MCGKSLSYNAVLLVKFLAYLHTRHLEHLELSRLDANVHEYFENGADFPQGVLYEMGSMRRMCARTTVCHR